MYLVNSKEEFIELYKVHCREPLQFQEYIASSRGKSIRVLVIDKEIVGAFIRFNNQDFRSNFGDNADGRKLENLGKYEEFVDKISNILQIEYAGIDLMFLEDDEPILCEINSNAFFEQFEKVTGINVAKRFAEMVIKKVGNQNEQE